MNMVEDFHMIGGEDKMSYAKNSSFQWLIQEQVKPILDQCIGELFKDMESLQNSFKVADLGCSSGPNAFFTAQNIIQCFEKHYPMNINHYEILKDIPIVQYFMNDLLANDFNLVFKMLPEFYENMKKENGRKNGGCIIDVVAGTFYGRLFPDSSMHFFHSSYGLHWLSQVPQEGLMTETGISMNKRNIHCAKRSPPVVQKLYRNQFRRDFSMFLRMRSRELLQQGRLLLTFLCENSEEDDDHNYLHLMASVLNDMVTQGCIEEEKLECFNLPIHFVSVGEIKEIIEEEGSFKILKFHSFKTPVDAGYEFIAFEDDYDSVPGRARYVATYLRAVFGPILASHFGEAIIEDMFHRYADKLMEVLHNGLLMYNTMVISLQKTM